jgi:D-alanine-D-alanine ligase-like ATP-grasp enzyme
MVCGARLTLIENNAETDLHMKNKKKVGSLVGAIFKRVAPQIGARVAMEPEWGIVGQITYKSGAKRYFRNTSIDLNTLGASEIAKDKDYANFFMKRMGYRTIPGNTFFEAVWAKKIGSPRTLKEACVYAKKMGYPVIVKPNSGSQGRAVALVHSEKELIRGLKRVFRIDRVALVQKPVHGKDYRIVVLDNKVISAYERIPLYVVGDGVSSIATLLRKKAASFVRTGRDTELSYTDPRMFAKLTQSGRSPRSVPEQGERVYLLDNANLSTGGDAVDMTDVIHPSVVLLAVRLTKDMGLRLCGVDLMIEGDITQPLKKYFVLEINSAPGLDHYVTSGSAQRKIVEDMYRAVLTHMEHL